MISGSDLLILSHLKRVNNAQSIWRFGCGRGRMWQRELAVADKNVIKHIETGIKIM